MAYGVVGCSGVGVVEWHVVSYDVVGWEGVGWLSTFYRLAAFDCERMISSAHEPELTEGVTTPEVANRGMT